MRLEDQVDWSESEYWSWLDKWRSFQPLDKALAKDLYYKRNVHQFPLLTTFLLTIHLKSRGFVCLDIPVWAGKNIVNTIVTKATDSEDQNVDSLQFPECGRWIEMLEREGKEMVLTFDGMEEYPNFQEEPRMEARPAFFVLDQDHLYVRKNYFMEKVIVEKLQGLKRGRLQTTSTIDIEELDDQERAIRLSKWHQFLIVSGGPGTGKTTTIYRMVKEKMMSDGEDAQHLKIIQLLAPTGKAVFRLRNSFQEQLDNDQSISDRVRLQLHQIMESASTLHRFLINNQRKLGRWLNYDLLIIDESSMIAMEPFYQLLNQIYIPFNDDLPAPLQTQLVLIGDKDQLPPVDDGFVFTDLINSAIDIMNLKKEGSADQVLVNLFFLRKNYRFTPESVIGKLAADLRDRITVSYEELTKHSQDSIDNSSFRLLNVDKGEVMDWWKENVLPVYNRWVQSCDDLSDFLEANKSVEYWVDSAFQNKLEEVFQLVNSQIILCSHRSGEYGLETINKTILELLQERGQLRKRQGDEFQGKVVMVTQNDYQQELYNGDVGVYIYDERVQNYRIFFEDREHGYLPHDLPGSESYFATSIHKSQGSEFDRVLLLFPPVDETDSDDIYPFLTRELFYTGLTRARKQVAISGEKKVIDQMLSNQMACHSKLIPRVWE